MPATLAGHDDSYSPATSSVHRERWHTAGTPGHVTGLHNFQRAYSNSSVPVDSTTDRPSVRLQRPFELQRTTTRRPSGGGAVATTVFNTDIEVADEYWNTRATEMENAVEEVTYEFITLDDASPSSEYKQTWLSQHTAWVEQDWFLVLTAAVVFVNVLMFVTSEREKNPSYDSHSFEVICLIFYICELLLRGAHHGPDFFVGPWRFVLLNWAGGIASNALACALRVPQIDVFVVIITIMDQLLLPALTSMHRHHPNIAGIARIFRMTRLLRAVRVFKWIFGSNWNWAAGKQFETFIAVVIAFNAIIMGFETDTTWDGWYWVEQALLSVFVFELVARFKVRGCREFFCGDPGEIIWNWLDFVIVASGALDQWGMPIIAELGVFHNKQGGDGAYGHFITLLRLFRLVRVLRLIKLVRAVKPLYLLAMGVVEAMQAMFWVMVLTMVMIYGFSILLTNLIGHGLLVNIDSDDTALVAGVQAFQSVPNTMFTMFLVMNGEFQALFPLFDVSPGFRVLFILFEVASTWGLLAILTAVVSDNMISVANKHEAEEMRDRKDSEWSQTLAKLSELVVELDKDGSKFVSEEELASFLNSTENADRLREVAQITKGDAAEIMKSIAQQGEVQLDDLVESFAKAAQPVTEKSMLRLEARVRKGVHTDLDDVRQVVETMQVAHIQQIQAIRNLSDLLAQPLLPAPPPAIDTLAPAASMSIPAKAPLLAPPPEQRKLSKRRLSKGSNSGNGAAPSQDFADQRLRADALLSELMRPPPSDSQRTRESASGDRAGAEETGPALVARSAARLSALEPPVNGNASPSSFDPEEGEIIEERSASHAASAVSSQDVCPAQVCLDGGTGGALEERGLPDPAGGVRLEDAALEPPLDGASLPRRHVSPRLAQAFGPAGASPLPQSPTGRRSSSMPPLRSPSRDAPRSRRQERQPSSPSPRRSAARPPG